MADIKWEKCHHTKSDSHDISVKLSLLAVADCFNFSPEV